MLVVAAACSDATTPRPVFAPDSGADVDGDITPDPGFVIDAGGGTACALPHSFGSPKCDECVATNCCATLAACAADPGCRLVRDCILECIPTGARKCADTCLSKYPDDAGLWNDLEWCWSFTKPCKFDCTVTPS